MSDAADRLAIAKAFTTIGWAALEISEVLHKNDALNNTVPTNWPLGLSADEFAAECFGMAQHYKGEGQ